MAQSYQSIRNWFGNERFSDVTFKLVSSRSADSDPKLIKLHRLILADRSPYFDTLFQTCFNEHTKINSGEPIELVVDSVENSIELLKWMYQPLDYSQFPLSAESAQLADYWLIRPKLDQVKTIDVPSVYVWKLIKLVSSQIEIIFDNSNMRFEYKPNQNSSDYLGVMQSIMNNYLKYIGWTFDTFLQKHFPLAIGEPLERHQLGNPLLDTPSKIKDYAIAIFNKLYMSIFDDPFEIDDGSQLQVGIFNYLISESDWYDYEIIRNGTLTDRLLGLVELIASYFTPAEPLTEFSYNTDKVNTDNTNSDTDNGDNERSSGNTLQQSQCINLLKRINCICIDSEGTIINPSQLMDRIRLIQSKGLVKTYLVDFLLVVKIVPHQGYYVKLAIGLLTNLNSLKSFRLLTDEEKLIVKNRGYHVTKS